ncbi:MAG: transcriptional regulator, partial [Gammaproteobacteria bacterium]|nr:transcriptional regulator [Gammaproteobacteria bacterium]
LSLPKNEHGYDTLVTQLDELLNIIGENENHELIGLADTMSNLIQAYDEAHRKKTKNAGINALRYLMEEHNLHQSDLPQIASQGVMSEILNGKRDLNLRQIKLLAQYFYVNPSTFID